MNALADKVQKQVGPWTQDMHFNLLLLTCM